jgi:hypothetical protein
MPRDFNPYWLPDAQTHALETEKQRHNQALWMLGEYCMFIMRWHEADFHADLVRRCPECVTAYGMIGEVFKQPAKDKCPTCFGTTFEGGYRAKIIRPTLIEDVGDRGMREGIERGVVEPQTMRIQTTPDFWMRDGDWIIRADNTRWKVDISNAPSLATGFGFLGSEEAPGYAFANIVMEDPTTPVYLVPPVDSAEVETMLDKKNSRVPGDFSAYEDIKGPLIQGLA